MARARSWAEWRAHSARSSAGSGSGSRSRSSRESYYESGSESEGSSIGPPERQRHSAPRDVGIVPAAGQEAKQPSALGRDRKADQRPHPAPRQPRGGRGFVHSFILGHLGQGRRGDRVGNAAGAQLPADAPAGLASVHELRARELTRIRRIVEQAGGDQPLHRGIDIRRRIPVSDKTTRQLDPAVRPPGEQREGPVVHRLKGRDIGKKGRAVAMRAGRGSGPRPTHIASARPRLWCRRRDARNSLTRRPRQPPPRHPAEPVSGRMPSTAFTFSSTSAMSAGLSLRNIFAFSRPWPIRCAP